MVQNGDFGFRGRVIKAYSADGGAEAAKAVCVSPSDEMVVSCHKEKISVWNLKTGERVGSLDGHRAEITCCSTSRDLLATGAENGIMHLWKYKDLKRVARIGLPSGPITGCSLSNSGRTLAVGWAEGNPRIYTIFGGDGSLLQGPTYTELTGHDGAVTSMRFSPNAEDQLLTSSNDGTVRLWKVSTGKCLLTIEPDEGPVLQADYSGDLNVIFLTKNGGFSVWNIDDNTRVWQVKGDYRLIAGSVASQAVMTSTSENRLLCYNVAQKKDTAMKGTSHDGAILSSAVCASGNHFVTGGADGKVFLWE